MANLYVGLSMLLDEASALEAMPTPLVHPCSSDALIGPIQAAERDLIEPLNERWPCFARERRKS